MKNLKQFLKFDNEAFFKDKTLIVKEVKPTIKYENGEATDKVLGTTVVAVIVRDNTTYTDKDNQEVRNLNFMESFNIKVPNKKIEIAQGVQIKPVSILKSSVYGNYQNQLSIECEDIKRIEKQS